MAVNPQSTPNISAFDPATGAKKWTFNTNYINFSSPLLTGGDLLFGGDEKVAPSRSTPRQERSCGLSTRAAESPLRRLSFSVGGRQFVAISLAVARLGSR